MLYHRKPDRMVGTELMPLNELKHVAPELFDAHELRYQDRPAALEQRLHAFERTAGDICRWGDVVFLTPVRPKSIKRGLTMAGIEPQRGGDFLAIDPMKLDITKAVLWLGNDPDAQADYRVFRRAEVEMFAAMPMKAIDRYIEVASKGGRPYLFAHLPHVLYRGRIDVSDADTVHW